MHKVLFLGAGRRVELINRFNRAGFECYSYEVNQDVPAQDVSFVIQGLPWDAPDIVSDIATAAIINEIDLIIPCQDAAVPIATKLGEIAVASIYESAMICLDKREFEKFMLDNFSENYPNFDRYKDTKFVCKPARGYGSNGIVISEDVSILDKPANEPYICQRFIKGTEYSVDAYFDKNGKYVDSVQRYRHRVSGGEVIISETVHSPKLANLTEEIGNKIGGLKGPINFQYIFDNKPNGTFYLFEINARFGGGYTLSMEAGLNAIKLIKRDWLGEEFEYTPNQWKHVVLQRSFKDHYFER